MHCYAQLKFTFFILLLLLCFQSPGFAKPTLPLNKINRIGFVKPSGDPQLRLAEKNDMLSLRESVLVSGIPFDEITSDQINKKNALGYDLLIIPSAAATRLTKQQNKTLMEALRAGAQIFTDSISGLSETAGFQTGNDLLTVEQIRDIVSPADTLFWAIPSEVYSIRSKQNTFKSLCVDNQSKAPLVASAQMGKGKIVFSAPLFDPFTDKGYSRFSYFIELLDREFNIRSLAHRKEVEMYLDLGVRTGENLDSLAVIWKKQHIKRINASGWYYDDHYTNYQALINACHSNGIAVYCWLETPMISEGFWNRHPEWREKTATLRDANVDWRKLMNFADENCRKQAAAEIDSFLLHHDWDGVNLAELYFEPSPVGPRIPQNFTPMNTIVRKDFEAKNGFDPILILDPQSSHFWEKNMADWKKFAQYRKDLAYQSKTFFLEHLTKVAQKKKDFEVMLTVLDVSLTPEVSENIGEDTQNTLALFKKFNITLQVEDPSTCWGMTPNRYEKMGECYRPYAPKEHQLLFDCNVVGSNERDEVYFPAQKPSGEEIRQICYYMAKSKSRPVFYSEEVVNASDYNNISTVLARETQLTKLSADKWKSTSPNMVYIKVSDADLSVKIDGMDWLAQQKGMVLIPSGDHTLEFSDYTPKAYQLQQISSELISARFFKKTFQIKYREELLPCFVSTSTKPMKIMENNISIDYKIARSKDGSYTVRLPSGEHTFDFFFE